MLPFRLFAGTGPRGLFFNKKMFQAFELIQGLSPEQIRDYIAKAQQGNYIAQNILVTYCYPKLCGIVNQHYVSDAIHRSDMVDTGVIGLIEAIRKFDLTKGNDLWAYARIFVQKRINELFQTVSIVSMTEHMAATNRCIEEAENAFIQEYEFCPTNQELAHYMKQKRKKWVTVDTIAAYRDRPQSDTLENLDITNNTTLIDTPLNAYDEMLLRLQNIALTDKDVTDSAQATFERDRQVAMEFIEAAINYEAFPTDAYLKRKYNISIDRIGRIRSAFREYCATINEY